MGQGVVPVYLRTAIGRAVRILLRMHPKFTGKYQGISRDSKSDAFIISDVN